METSLKERLKELAKRSTHYVIIGARGEGKTALAFKLLEIHKDFKDCFVYKYPNPSLLQDWIKNITKIENLPPNSVILIDEASNDFDQYSYAKKNNIYLRNLLNIARHKNQSYIFVTTTTKFINLNFLHLIDAYFLKKPNMFQRQEERRLIRKAYESINEDIKVNEFYYLDAKMFTKGVFEKPSWFTEEMSKVYEHVEGEKI